MTEEEIQHWQTCDKPVPECYRCSRSINLLPGTHEAVDQLVATIPNWLS